MANKLMGLLQVGDNLYELVDISGREATAAVDAKVDGLSASNISFDGTASGLSSTNTQNAIDEIIDRERFIAIGGNYMAEAQTTGRIKITIPYYNRKGYNQALLSQTTNIYVGIYGTKSTAGVYINVQNILIGQTFIQIIFDLASGYILDNYTDLAKGFLLELGDLLLTLSKTS